MYTPSLAQTLSFAALLLLGSNCLPRPAANLEGIKTPIESEAGIKARVAEPQRGGHHHDPSGFGGRSSGVTVSSNPEPSGRPDSTGVGSVAPIAPSDAPFSSGVTSPTDAPIPSRPATPTDAPVLSITAVPTNVPVEPSASTVNTDAAPESTSQAKRRALNEVK